MPIRIHIRRHAERNIKAVHGSGDYLTKDGIVNALRVGRKIKRKNWPTKIYVSPAGRSIQTAALLKLGSNSQYSIRTRSGLLKFVKPNAPQAAIQNLMKMEDHEIMRKWLEGKLERETVYTPNEVAMQAIYTMRHAPRAGRRFKNCKLRIEAVSHDATILSLFKVLTGKTPKLKSSDDSGVKNLESIEIIFGKRIILHYRRFKDDITKKFFELLTQARKLYGNTV